MRQNYIYKFPDRIAKTTRKTSLSAAKAVHLLNLVKKIKGYKKNRTLKDAV